MLIEGHGHELYDAALQYRYQAHYAGRIGTLYIHPPFEGLFYLAVAWLPLRHAYLLWALLNVTLLAAAARRLVTHALPAWDWRLSLAASLTFIPVLLCLVQGQDSLLLLLVVTWSFTKLRRNRALAAGCWLGVGLFKFQLVLPLMLVLLLVQKRNHRRPLATGFSLIALAWMALSAAISGWSVFTAYPRFLLHLQQQPFAGIIPSAMANFRGLTCIVFHRNQSAWPLIATFILSAGTLIKALTDWKRARLATGQNSSLAAQIEFDVPFAGSVLFSLLVSYHLNPHDLSLLLLPGSVLLHRALARVRVPDPQSWIVLFLLGILLLPPLHLWALRARVYALLALPLLFLFLTTRIVEGNSEAPRGILHVDKSQRED